MQSRRTRPISIALSVALGLTLGACGKKSLDKNVDRLVKAAMANDYAAFKDMSVPELPEQFPAVKFKLLSESLKLLGAYKDRSMRGIKARSGKVREGRYKLTFEKGTVSLSITLRRGKLTAFRFEGEDIEKAMKKVRLKTFSVFKVGSFEYLDADGKKKNNVFKAGDKVRYKITIHGMKRQGGTLKIQAGIRVVAANGQVVVQNPKFVDSAVPIKPDDSPVGFVDGNVTLKAPGHYKLQLHVTDAHAGKSLDYTTALLVE